ncbi:uncharacterized protein OCT59_024689 [Rhizophagus irregularis]|uniref:uncharacterized protein n=1 Tax=Rhizophagus irregularis TaxID=588596 RepID=UPI0033194B56|nr:hypothetical protein OCT59_024689 [Rhizophagus irregularis]
MKNKIFLGASRQGSGKASRHPLNKKTPQASDPLKSSYNNFKLLKKGRKEIFFKKKGNNQILKKKKKEEKGFFKKR